MLIISLGSPRISLLFKGVRRIELSSTFKCSEIRPTLESGSVRFTFVAEGELQSILAKVGFIAADAEDYAGKSPFAGSFIR